MPIYEYYCEECKDTVEELLSWFEANTASIYCEKCRKKRKRLPGRLTFYFVNSQGKRTNFEGEEL